MRAARATGQDTDGRELMLAVSRGAAGAFDRLVAEYGSYIRKLISRYVREPSMIDDLAQDVLVRLYGARERYVPTSHFEAFLQTIIFNLCVNHSRYERRRRAASLNGFCEAGEILSDTMADERAVAPDQEATRHERAGAVRQAIGRLPCNQRRALLLSHFDGIAHEEVGRDIGVSVAATKSLIWRAKENLRRMLEPQYADFERRGLDDLRPGEAQPVPVPIQAKALHDRRHHAA